MRVYHIFASVKIAQAILESNWGKSKLATQAHNLYGIKGSGPAGKSIFDTKEYDKDKGWRTVNTAFKKYHNQNESIKDHTQFLLKNKRYTKVFEASNYQQACHALQNAGYATDPNYAVKLIRLIEENKIYEIDQQIQKEKQNNLPEKDGDSMLRKGMSTQEVKTLQQNLIKLGYGSYLLPFGDDGSFGNNTEKAVIAFQKDLKLTVDGIVGEQTLQAIKDKLMKKADPLDPNKRIQLLEEEVQKINKKLTKMEQVLSGSSTPPL